MKGLKFVGDTEGEDTELHVLRLNARLRRKSANRRRYVRHYLRILNDRK